MPTRSALNILGGKGCAENAHPFCLTFLGWQSTQMETRVFPQDEREVPTNIKATASRKEPLYSIEHIYDV